MKFLRFVALVLALLVPSSAGASTILFQINGGRAVFGQVPFQAGDALGGNGFLRDGTARLVSGPLVSLDVDSINGLTTYAYGAGLLELAMTLTEGGSDVTGSFSAPTEAFSFVVCEGCDRRGNANAPDFVIPLGPGLFDANVADFFHIDPHTLGGFVRFGLEDIDGGPLSDRRVGFDHGGFALIAIEVRDIPEPSLLLALSLGAAAIFGRRGISRARTSARR